MKPFHRTSTALLLAALLTACNGAQSTPTLSQDDMLKTAIATVSTGVPETQSPLASSTPMALPAISLQTATPTPSPAPTQAPTSTPQVFTDPSIPLSERIVFYYFVTPGQNPIPQGTIRAVVPLAPAYADETYTSDTAADIRTALEIVLHENRNIWDGSDLQIAEVRFREGHADVILQGEYFGNGGAVLEAASRQILLTVFANPSVQTGTISLNGDTIWNLGVSNSMNAKPDDYVYTRTEMEAYMNQYVYP